MHNLATILTPIKKSLTALIDAGGTPYLVGGCVRDHLLKKPLKDLDIEIHGLDMATVEQVLKKHATVMLVGKQFGVFKSANHPVDWSLPRRDSLGRKPEVAIDPHLGIAQACKRRDLTMNAMAIDLKQFLATNTITIIDPYGGQEALVCNELRAVDATLFLEDPLRFFRVMQFVGRFAMHPDAALNRLCASMALRDPITQAPLAIERIAEEIKKLLLQSERPSLGFRWLQEINRLNELMPELHALINTPQRADYHPEGNVFEHTMQTIDAMAHLHTTGHLNDTHEAYYLILAALCHDVGKATTTDINLHAHGHEQAGLPITKTLLARISIDHGASAMACKLIRHHLVPFVLLAENATDKAYKRLAAKLAPEATMRQLGLLSLADRQGRNGASHEPLNTLYDLFAAFIQRTEQAAVTHGPEAPVLLGRHLLDIVPAGPQLGKLVAQAYEIQLDTGIKDVAMLRELVLKQA